MILGHRETGEWQWISRAVVEEEVENTPDSERPYRVRSILKSTHTTVALIEAEVERARQIKAMGVRTYDALHIACAEQLGVDVFLTTDDRIIHTATRHAEKLKVTLANPLDWLLEVT